MHPLNGKEIAEKILAELKSRPVPKKFLAGVLIGNDPASESFQRIKQKTAEKLGVDYRIYHFEPELGNDNLREQVLRLANHKTCGGILVQLPLPQGLNAQYIVNVIPREKDPDVLGERALGAFYADRNPVLPPAVATVSEIIENLKLKIENSHVVVVGRGPLVGKPVAVWLLDKAKDLIVAGKETDLNTVLKDADLVITGTGVAGLIKPEMLGLETSVIDFGYGEQTQMDTNSEQISTNKPKLAGDFDPSSLQASDQLEAWSLELGAFFTPTPGGTGPILVAKLFENFYNLNNG